MFTTLLIHAATRWSFERGFIGYLNEIAEERVALALPRLSQAYAEHQNWDFLRSGAVPWFDLMRSVDDAKTSALARGMYAQADLTGVVLRLGLLDAQFQRVAGYSDISPQMPRWPVVSGNRTVGWLVLTPFQSVADTGAQRFSHWMLKATVMASVTTLFMAALIAWWVSRRLLAPVRRVAAATHRLATGHYDVRVDVASPDEVGQLASDFNHLAQTLERNEALRREFVADVSHELRTPLSVLRAELEALEDGIRPLNGQAIASLQGEVAQLGNLVDDLYELALTDVGALSYRMEPMDLGVLLQGLSSAHEGRILHKGLRLEVSLPMTPAMVRADPGRLTQMFDNLLENSCRYTDAPGCIRIATTTDDAYWLIEVSDSAPGVSDAHLSRLFERFYRVEGSRSRSTGGAGLGLAIVRNIVQAHGGTVEIASSPMGGISILVRLPHFKETA